jgi:nitronate monooxygenase
MLASDAIVAQAAQVRSRATGPLNLNFFSHRLADPPDETGWRALLAPFYADEGVSAAPPPPLRRPFDDAQCAAVEQVRPEIVSFHFGLPDAALLARVKASGAIVLGNATTVAEARDLATQGCDAIIAQGGEAGGHAGYFLDGYSPTGLLALIPQIADATGLPVIAAGGIADARGVRAVIAAGASAVQIGTAYLATPESLISAPHRALLGSTTGEGTIVTNLFSGGLARGFPNRLTDALGAIHPAAPPFPYASAALAPLRTMAEAEGRGDYSPMWAGQAAALAREIPAAMLTAQLGAALNAAQGERP